MSTATDECPPPVSWLGYGGLLPFVGLVALTAFNPQRSGLWSDALVAYGAVILSFVGALHWGFAMSAEALPNRLRQASFRWSIVPALMAWPAVVVGGAAGSLMLVAGFVLHMIQDHRLAGPAALPAWYLPLRRRLTWVVTLCLIVHVGLEAFHD